MTKNENEAKLNETLHESSRGRKVLRFLFEIAEKLPADWRLNAGVK